MTSSFSAALSHVMYPTDSFEVQLECEPNIHVTLTKKEFRQLNSFTEDGTPDWDELSPKVRAVIADHVKARARAYKPRRAESSPPIPLASLPPRKLTWDDL